MPNSIPIFYQPDMSAAATSYSQSPSKPTRVVEHWLARGHIRAEDIKTFPPATRKDLYTVHAQWYVDNVLDLIEPNGFGTREQAIADTFLLTTGSMLAAALHVAQHGGVACSPTSGFHHAHYAQGGGFCTFNGLMVAAAELNRLGKKVGILDCDAHYGDGTQDIIEELGFDPAYIKHHTMGELHPPGARAPYFMDWLDAAISDLADCDVVLYQAGADPWERDPLGGQLSLTELAARDLFVFSGLKNVAWNFAGGYSPAVTAIHTNTLLAAQGKFDESN